MGEASGPASSSVSHRTADFEYALPPELIAQEPSTVRGESRLLVVDRRTGSRADRAFGALPELIPTGDLVVLNTTRVRHARLLGTRPGGGATEVLLLHPGPDGTWVAIGKPGRALKPGKRVELAPGCWIETVALLPEGYRAVRFVGIEAEAAMARFGRLPLPPYIARNPRELDETRYQTVYADREASIAAPTAGLHFTPALLDALERRGVELVRIELEVGAGTFKPVEVDDPRHHPMHPERYTISPRAAEQIARARERGARLWAVGTTVVRALESAAEPDGTVRAESRETRLLITPGYTFRVVDHLLTNFHLPRSTLLMLVAAFLGYDATMDAYRHAIAERYRFYSYGDAMLVI